MKLLTRIAGLLGLAKQPTPVLAKPMAFESPEVESPEDWMDDVPEPDMPRPDVHPPASDWYAGLDSYAGGPVSRDLLEVALDFVISLEYASSSHDDDQLPAYDAVVQANFGRMTMAKHIIRRFGEGISPRDLQTMQDAYYSFTNSPKYLVNPVVLSVVRSMLNHGWHGIGPWQQ